MIRSIFTILTVASLAGFAAGCAVETAHDQQADDESSDIAGELSTSTESYVTLRRDTRRCMAPLCGGYWLHEVNRKTADQYVSGLDLTAAGAEESDLVDAIVKGKLSKKDKTFGTRSFVVSEAYRALPGVTAGDGESVYVAHDRDPKISCFTAPCNNEIGQKINSTAKAFDFTRLSVDRAALPFVDKQWLTARVLQHGALVAGKTVNGDKFPGGYEKVLDVSQIWIRIPDHVGPCPKIAVRLCEDGTVSTYSRNGDRCLIQAECVTPGFCPMFLPACPEGYTLSSWRSGKAGCNAYVCDPTFVVPSAE